MTAKRKTCQVTNAEKEISALLLIMTQPYQKKDGTAFIALCVCECICMSVLQMASSNQTWDSNQDDSFTA